MRIGVVKLSELDGLNLTAERYLLSAEEMREALTTPLRARIAKAEAEIANIEKADRRELYRRYGDRFWRR